jgi:hypothetical protein
VALLLEQPHEILLIAHGPIAQDAQDGFAAIGLLGVG